MFFNLFNLAIKNPFNRKARQQHDAKPTSSYFENPTKNNIERDRKITFNHPPAIFYKAQSQRICIAIALSPGIYGEPHRGRFD